MALFMVLGAAGINIPFFRQLIGFVYLTFIPGLLILKLFRFQRLGFVETILYSVGLSLAFDMFLGLFINVFFLLFNLPRPISTLPVDITFSLVTLILLVIVYFRERNETVHQAEPTSVPWPETFSPPCLFLVSLPVISAVGAYYLANFYHINTLLLILLALIAVAAFLIAINKFIPRKLYPLAIAMISLSLLWHMSLISRYITGADIHHEYFYQSLVLSNGFWDSSLPSNINSMLSVVMLGPIYSLIADMDLIWILKIIYPLFFSLVPLALFQVYRKRTDDKVAFFAAFFFMSLGFFLHEAIQLARMEVAELLFALFLLSLLDSTMVVGKKIPILIIFSLSIIVSHYGLSYFVLFYLVLTLLFVSLMKTRILTNLWEYLTKRLNRGSDDSGKIGDMIIAQSSSTNTLTGNLVFLYITFCFAWYMYLSAGSPFTSIINIGQSTFQSLVGFFFVETRESAVLMAIGMASPEITSIPRQVFLIIQYCIQFFIVAGVIGLLFSRNKGKSRSIYVAMTLVSSLLLLMCIILPHFSKNFNISRIYHITLFFLAPFCVLGGMTVFRWLSRLVTFSWTRVLTSHISLVLVVILVLIPYFLFYTAFIYAVTGDRITSIALNPELDYPRYNEQEIAAKEWLLSNTTVESKIYADWYGTTWLVGTPLRKGASAFFSDTKMIPDSAYIYLRSINVQKRLIVYSRGQMRQYVDLPGSAFGQEVLAYRSKVYDNSGAQVYH